MKKILSALLVVVMVFALAACGGETVTPDDTPSAATEEAKTTDETEPSAEDTTEEVAAEETSDFPTQEEILAKVPTTAPKGQIIVGDISDISSDFITGWTNGAANAAIKYMIHGYATVTYTREGKFVFNPVVVKSYDSVLNSDGSKTYTITIYDNLKWNDGSSITVKDYIFNKMLNSAPEWAALQANATDGVNLVGYDSFNAGHLVNKDGLAIDKDGNVIEVIETDAEGNSVSKITDESLLVPCKSFAGIRMIDDYTYSATIKAEELPYFYETTLVNFFPQPMSIIAPGVELTDTPEGVTLSDNFTADLLTQTVLNTDTGYRYKPVLTCGPYNLESFDVDSNVAVLTANPNFLATYDGAKPQIEKIIIKHVIDATQMDELRVGSVDLIQGAAGDRILVGLEMVDEGLMNTTNYPRAGYGQIVFQCDFGPTQFVEVRQAIAWLLDRDEFCRQFTQGYGIVVDGRYGESRWEYQENKDLLDEILTKYTLNVDKAKEVLIAGGWTLNKDGNDFVEGTDDIRYKDVNGALMALEIEWINAENNAVAALLATMLVPEVSKVGMKINSTTTDFTTLLNNLYRDGISDIKYHMYNLATGFATADSPWYYYNPDPAYAGQYNNNFINDAELYSLAVAMKSTDPQDFGGWSEKWVEFQKRWNYLLPDIPLYSNTYYDFFAKKLQNYNPTSGWNYGYELVYASVSE